VKIREFSAQQQQQMCFNGCIAQNARRSAQTTKLCNISECKAQARTHLCRAARLQATCRQISDCQIRAAQCFAGKLHFNATGWSQAVLGMIGQCRTDRCAPFSEYECTHQQHWVHGWSWSLTYGMSFIHLAVHKGVLSLWIVQL